MFTVNNGGQPWVEEVYQGKQQRSAMDRGGLPRSTTEVNHRLTRFTKVINSVKPWIEEIYKGQQQRSAMDREGLTSSATEVSHG